MDRLPGPRADTLGAQSSYQDDITPERQAEGASRVLLMCPVP